LLSSQKFTVFFALTELIGVEMARPYFYLGVSFRLCFSTKQTFLAFTDRGLVNTTSRWCSDHLCHWTLYFSLDGIDRFGKILSLALSPVIEKYNSIQKMR
jgi:hypothetical protein